MADDILKFLGIKPDDTEHPANTEVLSFLGLKPIKEDHPAYTPYPGMEDPEKRFREAPAPGSRAKSTMQKVHEATDPSTVIPAVVSDIAGNIRDSAVSSAGMTFEGIGDIGEGRSATGVGKVAMGALGVPLSLVTGPVRSGGNFLDSVIGKPNPVIPTGVGGNPTGDGQPVQVPGYGDRAAMVFPLNIGGPAVRTAAHNIHPTTKAADFIAGKVGPENMPNFLSRLESNPRLRPIDVNDQVRMSGQGLVAGEHSPMASRTITESMRNSAAGARDAVKGTYNETMGAPPDAWEELTRLQDRTKSVGQAKIAPAVIGAKPVDTSGVIADIDKVLKPGVQAVVSGEPKFQSKLQSELAEWKSELTDGSSLLTDADKLHTVQSEMRRRAEELSMHPETRRLGRQLYDYRAKLVGAIDKAAPGLGYKEGLKAYRDEKDIERAFQLGQNLLINSKDPKSAPGYLKDWMASKDRTPEELAAARTGARQAIEQKMGAIKQSALDPARSGTDVPQIEFNKQKIEHLFGKEATEKMFKHLQDERDIALTNNRGLGNSKTAETLLAVKELTPRDISKPTSQLPAWATALGLGGMALSSSPTVGGIVGGSVIATRGAKSGYDWLARRNEISRNNALAEIMTRNDPETRALLSVAAQRVGQRNKLGHLLAPP